ncbi:hypothetical protein [Neotamlana laminarinivorans]|uniref:DUF5017 domain-containing protein n=1 Tax=Neotamlana laminarinivorans TaxID=2883124 RepID=A0A9X1HZ47_9FLAO|nr:hypothetical protein [Tamlana laminarinivorans]MCB4797975.1 hypothetical protein [Tamlana laminarinivorans]
MKKFIYLLILIVGGVFTSCNPMEDIYEELDSQETEGIDYLTGVTDYTLTDDDYDFLSLSYGNFSSEDEARLLIPDLLAERFPVWGESSLANVTYLLYDPLSFEDYTVTSSDYSELGLEAFTSMTDIENFFDLRYETAEKGTYVNLTYATLADVILYEITGDDFDAIGSALSSTYPDPAESAANYSNFDRREGNSAYWSDDMIVEALNVILPTASLGQQYNVTFAIYNGSSGTETFLVEYNGTAYVKLTVNESELVDEDYDAIVAALSSTYPDATTSMNDYGNFERRPTNAAYWSDDMIVEALNVVLSAGVEDERYAVTFAIYDGGTNFTETMDLTYSGGVYIKSPQLLLDETTLFVLTDGWAEPFSISEEAYTAMGQSYPNFDDEDEALYKLAIYLSQQYPYAFEDDMIAVAYDFYNGDETVVEYVNFVYDGSSWNAVQSVIEQTLQFGYEDGAWLPDNTIQYTMVGADYTTIAAEFADVDGFISAAASMGSYGNYDRREGNSAYWSDEMILETIKFLLDEIDPSAEEGQKYSVSYAVWIGSDAFETFKVIKENGEWVDNN